eukprot:3379458-Rhodomonas_salina.2
MPGTDLARVAVVLCETRYWPGVSAYTRNKYCCARRGTEVGRTGTRSRSGVREKTLTRIPSLRTRTWLSLMSGADRADVFVLYEMPGTACCRNGMGRAVLT